MLLSATIRSMACLTLSPAFTNSISLLIKFESLFLIRIFAAYIDYQDYCQQENKPSEVIGIIINAIYSEASSRQNNALISHLKQI